MIRINCMRNIQNDMFWRQIDFYTNLKRNNLKNKPSYKIGLNMDYKILTYYNNDKLNDYMEIPAFTAIFEGKIVEINRYKQAELHCEYGPAIISFNDDGSLKSESCYLNSKLNSLSNKPAFLKYNNDDVIIQQHYTNGHLNDNNGEAAHKVWNSKGFLIEESHFADGIKYEM